MRRIFFIAAGVLMFALALSQISQGEERILERKMIPSGQEYVPGEIIVKFKPGVPESQIAALNARRKASVIYSSRLAGLKRIRIPRGKKVADLVQQYRQDPSVEYAEPNYIAYAQWVPNDELYSYQWHMDNSEYDGINAETAWDIETGDPGVVIAVLDTGVAYEDYSERVWWWSRYYYLAPDLANTLFVPGYDFVNGDSHPNDDEGHGTHVTGTIAQSTDNGVGVAGVAFNCSIMPVKVLNSSGSGTYANIADSIIWAADNGAQVINMSLGGSNGSITLRNALEYAYNKNVTIVCSSGNNGSPDTILYPAADDEFCIAMGATRYDETVTSYSNGGASLDLVAPGGDLAVDQNGDGYGDGVLQQTFGSSTSDMSYWFYEGTSMAAPHVSGVAALVIAHNVASSPDDVREVLQTTAEDRGPDGWDSEYGWGIVDAYAALTYTATPNNPPVADAGGPYWGAEDNPLEFDGSGSYDPDADADNPITLTYAWNFGDGTTGSGVNPSHIYTAGGIYTVTLMVNDGLENSDTSETTAGIVGDNDRPVADPGGPYNGTVDVAVNFDASSSYDPEGSPLTYFWDFGNGSTAGGVSPSHVYSSAGTYTVTLTVSDGELSSDPATTTATIIIEVNDPPVADAGADQSALAGEAVLFDGNGSYDPDGDSITYAWNFGDGTTGSGVNPSHIYDDARTYTVTLTVTDDGGLSDSDTALITVTEAPSEIEVFADSFEVNEWNGLWSEDTQNDWFRSTQRAIDGSYSAEVDGRAVDARLTSIAIDLGGRTNASISFSWYIERRLDSGEYLAFDVSTDAGATWTEKARLRGNVDQEDTWHNENIELSNINTLKIRFRGKMSRYKEDANVDKVKVIAY